MKKSVSMSRCATDWEMKCEEVSYEQNSGFHVTDLAVQ